MPIINLELMREDHVLACPFCGGSQITLSNTHTACYAVSCDDCTAEISGKAYGTTKRSSALTMKEHAKAKASALMRWNGRVHPDTGE